MSPRILIVDDSVFICQLLQQVFAAHGWEPRVATDAESALSSAATHTPDLILLDVRMPGTDGWQALRALRADPRTREIRVAVMSTDDSREAWELAVARGAQAYIEKPFSPSVVVAIARGLLPSVPESRQAASA